jgi:hypothetical protein
MVLSQSTGTTLPLPEVCLIAESCLKFHGVSMSVNLVMSLPKEKTGLSLVVCCYWPLLSDGFAANRTNLKGLEQLTNKRNADSAIGDFVHGSRG